MVGWSLVTRSSLYKCGLNAYWKSAFYFLSLITSILITFKSMVIVKHKLYGNSVINLIYLLPRKLKISYFIALWP